MQRYTPPTNNTITPLTLPQGIFSSNQTAIPYLVSQEFYAFNTPSGSINTRTTTPGSASSSSAAKPRSTTTAIPLTDISAPTPNWDHPRNRERMLRLILSVSVSGENPLFRSDAEAFVAGYKRHKAFRDGALEMLAYLMKKRREEKRSGKGKEDDEVDARMERERIRVLKVLIGKAGGKAEVERLVREDDGLAKGRKQGSGSARGRGQMDPRLARAQFAM